MPEISLVLQNALAAGVLREIKVRITGARLVGKVVPKGKDEKGFTEEQHTLDVLEALRLRNLGKDYVGAMKLIYLRDYHDLMNVAVYEGLLIDEFAIKDD